MKKNRSEKNCQFYPATATGSDDRIFDALVVWLGIDADTMMVPDREGKPVEFICSSRVDITVTYCDLMSYPANLTRV